MTDESPKLSETVFSFPFTLTAPSLISKLSEIVLIIDDSASCIDESVRDNPWDITRSLVVNRDKSELSDKEFEKLLLRFVKRL